MEESDRIRKFPWAEFLDDWNRRMTVARARSVVQFGVLGDPAHGWRELVEKSAREAGDTIDAKILAPIDASDTFDHDSAVAVLKQAATLLQKIEHFIPQVLKPASSFMIIRNQGLSFEPATIQQIQEAESRLGVSLPDSYRQFLLHSNGWLSPNGILLGANDIAWFAKKDPTMVQDWSGNSPAPIEDKDYFVYGSEQYPHHMRGEYLKDCLVISQAYAELPNERLLLNRAVVFSNGEWEAWHLSPRLPGAVRVRSFAEMMELEKRRDLHSIR